MAPVAKDAPVIDAKVDPPAMSFVARLVAKARALGEAKARRSKPWRDPRKLWPLFGEK